MTERVDQACALYIEQEIRRGLDEGKKPWTIGKELSKWVEKLFEVTINPRTLERRAERVDKKDTTNVVEKSQPIESATYSPPPIIENRKPQGGGARDGAGRPAKIERREVSDAYDFATMAISQLERIQKADPQRENALIRVINWCKKEMENA